MDVLKTVLMVRHVPPLSPALTTELFSHYGAMSVYKSGFDCVKLVFPDENMSLKAMLALHQQKIFGSIISVEYCPAIEASSIDSSARAKAGEEAKHSFDVGFGPSPLLYYKYPPPCKRVLENISQAIATVPRLYVNVLHLMNKMNLPPPFLTMETEDVPNIDPRQRPARDVQVADASTQCGFATLSDESEVSSDPDPEAWAAFRATPFAHPVKPVTTKRRVAPPAPLTGKRARVLAVSTTAGVGASGAIREAGKEEVNRAASATALDAPILPAAPAANTQPTVTFAELFEGASSAHLVTETASTPTPTPTIQVVLRNPPPPQPVPSSPAPPPSHARVDLLGPMTTTWLSEKELVAGRAPTSELLERFADYQAGTPTSMLYVKNIARKATHAELVRIFGGFLGSPADPAAIEHFTQGRMRNQAFVRLPSPAAALLAIRAVHGFILHGKPLIVSFAKQQQQQQ
eukprot:m.1130 g.1130  ORF g.1130 m.1130 type:complete len:461 (-) comp658_c0_seq1:1-1383(-)